MESPKCTADLHEAVETGTDPNKSLKRKRAEEAEAAEQQKREEESKKVTMFHPITGAKVLVAPGERQALLQYCQGTMPGDVAVGSAPTRSYHTCCSWTAWG